MIERKGTVVSAQGNLLQVKITAESTCASCGHRGQCNPDQLVEIPLVPNALPGDEVTLSVDGGTLCASACAAYLLPAFAMLVGALAVEGMGYGTGASIVGAFVGLFGGLIGGRLISKYFIDGSVAPSIAHPVPPCSAPRLTGD